MYIFVIKHEVYHPIEIYLITRSGGNSDFKQWLHKQVTLASWQCGFFYWRRRQCSNDLDS